jgi:hypothetical protein
MGPVGDYTDFLRKLKDYDAKLSEPAAVDKGTELSAEIEQFLIDNQTFIQEGTAHPNLGLRDSLNKLKDRIIKVGDLSLQPALQIINKQIKEIPETQLQDLPLDVLSSILKDTPNMGAEARVSKILHRASDRARIIDLNQTQAPLRSLFKNTEQAVNFIANTPEGAQIHYLDFSRLQLTNEQLEKVLKNCPNLRHLNVEKTLISGDALKHLVHVKSLVSLNISFCAQLEPDALKHLVHVKSLISLDISYCIQLKPDALKHLEHVTSLASLDISYCGQLEPDALKHLVYVKSLTSLDISGWGQLEADALKHLEHVKFLTFLNMAVCKQLEADALKQLEHVKSLILLIILGCEQLDRSYLAHFHGRVVG